MREAASHLKPIIQCAISQLMRSQEILQLMVADVDLEYCTITIRPENNKTGKLDIIPLRVEMKVILMNLIEENGGKTPFVFNYNDPRYGGKYRPVKSIQHAFQAARRRAGIEGLQFRDLRRTGATRLHEAGVDPLIVQRLLRHSSFKISEEVYIQSNLKMMKEALNKVDEKASKEIEKPSVLAHHWHTKKAEKEKTPTIPLFSMN
jgi:integrase